MTYVALALALLLVADQAGGQFDAAAAERDAILFDQQDVPPVGVLVDRQDHRGEPAEELLPAVEIAISRYQQIVQLESEIADLGERFETRKRVDRALDRHLPAESMTYVLCHQKPIT